MLAAILLFALPVWAKPDLSNQQDKEPIVLICDCQPEYPGGDIALVKHISQNINYPANCNSEIDGRCIRVVTRFDVDTCGNVINPRVIKGEYQPLNNALVQAINKLQSFKPCPNQRVPVTFTLPMHVSLQR